jgi:hypothetical protein
MISNIKTSRIGVSSRILVTAAMAVVPTIQLETQNAKQLGEGPRVAPVDVGADDQIRSHVAAANRPRILGRLASSAVSDALVPQNSMSQEELGVPRQVEQARATS